MDVMRRGAASCSGRRIFSDQEIYDVEMQRIFARAWNVVVHELQIPKTGDFFMSWIGADQVIAVRNRKGGVSVLLNSCRHRGAAVCRAEQGARASGTFFLTDTLRQPDRERV